MYFLPVPHEIVDIPTKKFAILHFPIEIEIIHEFSWPIIEYVDLSLHVAVVWWYANIIIYLLTIVWNVFGIQVMWELAHCRLEMKCFNLLIQFNCYYILYLKNWKLTLSRVLNSESTEKNGAVVMGIYLCDHFTLWLRPSSETGQPCLDKTTMGHRQSICK